jgi:predicted PurR-regulated permease PerM
MLVIFIGAIGGLLASGIIGLFVGSVILAVSFTLFKAWLTEPPESSEEQNLPNTSGVP